MIAHKNYVRPTKAEQERFTLIRSLGCICCLLAFGDFAPCQEIHHIVKGNRRMGHWYTLPLCKKHHQGKGEGLWTSIAAGSKAFARVHGTEVDLWLKCQHALGLNDELPASKILPRRRVA